MLDDRRVRGASLRAPQREAKTEQPPVEITVYENGPVIVRGAYRLQDRDRKEIDPGRETIALCRCGLSALKPFCDGNHALRGTARTAL